MTGAVKLNTAGGGSVVVQPASSIASDVTVNVPVTGVNNGTLVCSDSSGNVGIGTSSPSARLTVQDATSGDGTARFGSNGTYYGEAKMIYSTGEFRVGTYGSGLFNTFYVAGTERMRIDTSGNLLVGTTSNSRTAKVRFYKSGDNVLETETDNAGSGYIHIGFINPNGRVGYIATSGTSTAYVTSSDYRLKENIQPMQNALATVAQLNPVTYNWKADGSDGQGFIAHELQAVVPDCVTGEKDAVDAEGKPVYQGIDTSFLVATLCKAIQEQQAMIVSLTDRIAVLEAK